MLQHRIFVFIQLQFFLSCGGSIPDYISNFSVQKAKKSYQKDLENNQRNVDGDSSSAPGEGCFL
jgi:hypothetical protein